MWSLQDIHKIHQSIILWDNIDEHEESEYEYLFSSSSSSSENENEGDEESDDFYDSDVTY